MSNVTITLGPATGGGNVITDILIDGNTLTPAKYKNFVEKDYDQCISVQKTSNTTIHSVGIMVQMYDNSSVVYEGGGVRSIAGIQSASYTKSEDDAFLLLKADKTQLIDLYTKGETNSLLNNKADNGVSYSKGEDDALLLLKADKTQLIDSYNKSEDDAREEVYTKSEDDTLLFVKADKTQLIDSYTKGETDNFLNNNFVNKSNEQTITGSTTHTSIVNATGFVKAGKDDTSVLLAGDGNRLLYGFGGLQVEYITN
ncbi:MAG: hypothetical protein EZS28_033290 [Streblomastix strix]|uniref:Uncharacterized protein n=1 Tax=Streblomastix strix TaxID=222440 RepID=A0A5J4UM93_9EUKA|nr:MAG: hypothetical protein EZS28_033290 [Streblomastix strix]